MSEKVPDGISKLDIEVSASNKLFEELLAVLKKHSGKGLVSCYTVVGCLEVLKDWYIDERLKEEE